MTTFNIMSDDQQERTYYLRINWILNGMHVITTNTTELLFQFYSMYIWIQNSYHVLYGLNRQKTSSPNPLSNRYDAVHLNLLLTHYRYLLPVLALYHRNVFQI